VPRRSCLRGARRTTCSGDDVNGVTQPDVDAGRDFFIGALVLFNESEDCAWMTHPEFAENLVLHELGHVLGLADVDNTGEVMNNWLDTGTRISTYQAGDRAGLRVLYGAQPQRRRSLWRRRGIVHFEPEDSRGNYADTRCSGAADGPEQPKTEA